MILSGMPTKFSIPFANSAGGGFIQNPIPVGSLIGSSPGRASFTDGFPPLTFTPIASGGDPPWGADMNGILFMISNWSRWQAAGGAAIYDSTFSAAIGGYPKGSLLQRAATNDRYWLNGVDNNTSNPDSGGANWTAFPDLIVQQQAANYTATDSGIQNHPNITLPLNTPVASLIGAPIRFRIAFANTITTPDIVINGAAAATMKNMDGTAIVSGQFSAAGCLVEGFLVTTSDFRVSSPGKPVTSPPPATPFIPGMIFLWGAEVPPSGALECDGSLQLISSYPNLFAVIGTRFGGNGTTNFALPDCRGVIVRGWDHGRGLDPNAGSRTGSPFPSNITVVGDHVGSWETASIRASDISNAKLQLVGDLNPAFPPPALAQLKPLQQITSAQLSSPAAPGTPPSQFPPSLSSPVDLLTLQQSGSTGVGEGTQAPGTNPAFATCYSIIGNAIFTAGSGVETRPLNFNLMYCIAY